VGAVQRVVVLGPAVRHDPPNARGRLQIHPAVAPSGRRVEPARREAPLPEQHGRRLKTSGESVIVRSRRSRRVERVGRPRDRPSASKVTYRPFPPSGSASDP
jgi:hypothetical protein